MAESKDISKLSFVCELGGLAATIDSSVRDLKYSVTVDGTELVIINYRNCTQKLINITCDSLAEIAIKVIQNI